MILGILDASAGFARPKGDVERQQKLSERGANVHHGKWTPDTVIGACSALVAFLEKAFNGKTMARSGQENCTVDHLAGE